MTNTEAKERAAKWQDFTKRIMALEVSLAKLIQTQQWVLDGLLKTELEVQIGRTASELDNVFADRELLKEEYWGFYEHSA